MNIEGLDYNTQREQLRMPEYGREIQKMIDHACTLKSKEMRQACAESIIRAMMKMQTNGRASKDYRQKLWNHLAIMSDFKLDIDYPCDISDALKIALKPEPLSYPHDEIEVRHYGKMLAKVFEKLKTMPEGRQRDELIRAAANQMKRDLYQWGHGQMENEKIAADLERLTDGAVKLDLKTFKFERINPNDFIEKKTKGKKSK